MLLPEPLLKAAAIDGKALFAGQGDYFTIWNPDKYDEYADADLEHYEQDMEILSSNWDEE